MFDKRWGSGHNFAKQEVMSLHTQAARKKTKWRLLKLQFGFQIQKGFFMELGTMITRAQQQRNTTATQNDSSEFFVRRLEEYERTLSVLTTRIEESYAQEITLIGYFHHLLGILNELQCHFEGIAEESKRDIDSFEESATQGKENST